MRQDLYAVLSEIGRRLPDMRFGQSLCNVSHRARGYGPSDVWEVEDDELLAAAKDFLADTIENGVDHSATATGTSG
jgi:hypothetical protein